MVDVVIRCVYFAKQFGLHVSKGHGLVIVVRIRLPIQSVLDVFVEHFAIGYDFFLIL